MTGADYRHPGRLINPFNVQGMLPDVSLGQ